MFDPGNPRNSPRRGRADTGFTLVEVLISLTLIATAGIALLHSLTTAIRLYGVGNRHTSFLEDRWNEAVRFQARHPGSLQGATTIRPATGALQIERVILQGPEPGSPDWEVLRGKQ